MKHVERNLALHPNGTYYSVFGGVPRTLGTKKISEARRLLKLIREAKAVQSTDTPAGAPTAASEPVEQTVAVVPPVVPSGNGELAELKAMVMSLTVQVGQLINGGMAQPSATSFLPFWEQNRETVCSTVKGRSQGMYRGEADRLLETLLIYQRFERLEASKATGKSNEPDLWEIFNRLEGDNH